jgi:hypothetical protein
MSAKDVAELGGFICHNKAHAGSRLHTLNISSVKLSVSQALPMKTLDHRPVAIFSSGLHFFSSLFTDAHKA